MKKILFFCLLLKCFFGFTQSKTELIAIILDEHIAREIPRLSISKDDIIIVVNIIEDEKFLIGIDAIPLKTQSNFSDLKIINDVRVYFNFGNVSNKLKRKINKHFKTINEIREIHASELFKLTHYHGVSTFEINENNEIYIIVTPDDEYYYKKLKERKLKFSEDLKFTKDLY